METLLKYKSLIEIFAGLGTFIAAIIALYSIFELRKQRRAMYKPQLFLDSFTFEAINNPLLLENNLNKFRGKYNGKGGKTLSESSFVLYELENLGFGVAKSVECKWEFDYKSAYKAISNVSPSEYKWDKLINYDILSTDLGFQKTFNPEDLKTEKINFILPISQGGKKRSLSIPEIIVDCYLYFLLFKHKLTEEICQTFYHEEFIEMPKLKLKLKYKDLANKTYRMNLNIDVSCVSFQLNNDGTLNTMKDFAMFYFTISE